MARSSDIIALAKAGLSNNREHLINVCRCIIANEKRSSSLKESLDAIVRKYNKTPLDSNVVPSSLEKLILQQAPSLSLDEIILPEDVKLSLAQFFKEHENNALLGDLELDLPHKLLLSGPPGNGKTVLAAGIAQSLDLPFLVLDYSSVISSYLGNTGGNIANIFRTISNIPCVLFIDEMDTVLSERSGATGRTDVAETSRIVTTLLLEIDKLPSNVILIGATNHTEMLDRAVVRRFEHHWVLPLPEDDVAHQWIKTFSTRYPMIPILEHKEEILKEVDKWCISDIERHTLAWCRQWVVDNKDDIIKSKPELVVA